MTDSSYTHITILADRTASMGEFADGKSGPTKAELTTPAIHKLIRDQAALPGRTTFSLIQFDTSGTDRITEFARGDDPAILAWAIVPRGSTNLLDAVGTEITMTGERLAALPEDQRPGRVYFVTGTDGEENSSKEYSKHDVAKMVTHQREVYGWEFVFIGADIDAFAEAGDMGVPPGSTLSSVGVAAAAAYAATSDAITRSRGGGGPVTYTEEERRKAGK